MLISQQTNARVCIVNFEQMSPPRSKFIILVRLNNMFKVINRTKKIVLVVVCKYLFKVNKSTRATSTKVALLSFLLTFYRLSLRFIYVNFRQISRISLYDAIMNCEHVFLYQVLSCHKKYK